jgi:hypothetical protein
MRCGLGLFAIVSIALLSTAAVAELPTPTRDQVESYRTYGYITRQGNGGEPLASWERDLKLALNSRDPAGAAGSLSKKYSLSPESMKELVRLWLVADAFEELDGSTEKSLAIAREVHRRFIALVTATKYDTLVLEAAATALSHVANCDADEYATLINSAPDRASTGWLLAKSADCPAWYHAFALRVPQKATASFVAMGMPSKAASLAMYAYLNSDVALAHVDSADRAIAHAHLAFQYAELLWDLGLTKKGIAFVEALPPDVLRILLNDELASREIAVDGLGVRLEAEGEGPMFRQNGPSAGGHSSDTFRLDLAGAYYLVGRSADAERIFSGVGGIAQLNSYFACVLNISSESQQVHRCQRGTPMTTKALLLDHLLRRGNADPYLLAETFFSSELALAPTGAVAVDAVCNVFSESEYHKICEYARMRQVDLIRDDKSDTPVSLAAVRAAGILDFDANRAAFQKALDSAATHFGGEGSDDTHQQRTAREAPLPPRFAPLTLPDKYRGPPAPQDKSWIKSLAPLPGGYDPVRVDRDGQRVAVVSVSQNYDPTGEVSRGGYWVHLSNDGGKTWQKPLYTGLADLYPYVVLPDSKMPLFDGNTLDLAVDVQELDTSSITYPPVGLRSLRRQTNLYLKIPIADLTRDSVGDGLTDITREHLLLEPHAPGGDNQTPFLVGTGPSAKCGLVESPEQKALVLLLEKLFSVHTGAIIEPVDRDTGSADAAIASEMAAASRRDPNSVDRPIFLLGAPTDFACLQTDRMMIVYSETDIARLLRTTPDFHAVSLSKIVYDRAHDRGYVSWSAGWSGGTDRLRLVNGEWVLDVISSWIT